MPDPLLERARRVVEWAYMHGDDLPSALRLDEEADEGTLIVIEDALECAYVLVTLLENAS